jgi:chloramphenicol 3-O phosphotransferase
VELATSPGRIIFLNGTSSSGKTSLAQELLRVLDQPYFHMAVDAFGSMRARERTAELSGDELANILARTRAGFHRAVAGMAAAGNNIVVDHILSEPWRLLDCLQVFAGIDVVLVGVFCPPDELRRREEARGDRVPGQAEAQLAAVHEHHIYDVECDTSTDSLRDCALRIRRYLAEPEQESTFDHLRRTLQRV